MPVVETRVASRIWNVPLIRIEQVVSLHLGPGRVRGNEQRQCFSRQVSMYLAWQVGGWSTTRIGRFYNGRHHTTVLHAVSKIERLRRADDAVDAVDALLEVLTGTLAAEIETPLPAPKKANWQDRFVDVPAAVFCNACTRLRKDMQLLNHQPRRFGYVGFGERTKFVLWRWRSLLSTIIGRASKARH